MRWRSGRTGVVVDIPGTGVFGSVWGGGDELAGLDAAEDVVMVSGFVEDGTVATDGYYCTVGGGEGGLDGGDRVGSRGARGDSGSSENPMVVNRATGVEGHANK